MKKKIPAIALSLLLITNAGNVKGADGDFLWSARYQSNSGGGIGSVQSIVTDPAGYLYAAGYVSGTANGTTTDFDPNDSPSAVHNITGTIGLSAFVTKLDANKAFQWALTFDGSGNAIANGITRDGMGNVFVVGSFSGNISFGSTSLTAGSGGNGTDAIFLAKVSESGNVLWAKQIGGASDDNTGNGIIADALGNIYISGTFSGTSINFNPGGSPITLSANGQDAFIAKYDNAGNCTWARAVSGSGIGGDIGRAIALDGSNNIYVTGGFSGTADLDPGAGVANFTASGNNMDIFVLKLDNSGNYAWAKTVTTPNGGDLGYGITISPANEVLITGSVSSSSPVDFDPGAGTNNITAFGFWDVFVWNLSTGGNYNWAKIYGGSGIDEGRAITTDAAGNIYVTGRFDMTSDFGNAISLTAGSSFNYTDVFILKLLSTGESSWARQLVNDGSVTNSGHTIVAKENQYIYVGGIYEGTTDFDPGTGTFNLSPQALDEAFILKLASGSALPVNFGNINGHFNNNNLTVTWETLKENNNDHFEIEVSDDGVHFSKIGEVESKAEQGNSSTTLKYEFVKDISSGTLALGAGLLLVLATTISLGAGRKKRILMPVIVSGILLAGTFSCTKKDSIETDQKGTVYIRIAQIDKDGTVKYSRVLKIYNH